jgi:hypothetical protein
MKYLIILLLMLTSCATLNPPKSIEVDIPVAVSCVSHIPDKPNFISDEVLLTYTQGNFVTALHVDRLERQSYEAELEAVLAGCLSK